MGVVEVLPQAVAFKRRARRLPRACVYVLRCRDGSLYAGWTNDLARRLAAHRRGVGAKYTRSRLPVHLVAWWHPAGDARARSDERSFKALDRRAKLSLLRADEAFGSALHKPPYSAQPSRAPKEREPMPYAPPQADELDALTREAESSNVRIGTEKGDIVVKLFPGDAPVHSAAFLKLAKAGFYDGLTFHRVEPGFVVQGGDPDGNGTGGPGYRLKAEFNARPHKRGTLAMARSSDPDSAGSQFYLCLEDARFLDGQYTVFGEIVDGLDALDKIRRGDKMTKLSVEPASAGAGD